MSDLPNPIHRMGTDISQMKTKHIREEIKRADALFWAWQADGLHLGFNVEKYAEDLEQELLNRGHADV